MSAETRLPHEHPNFARGLLEVPMTGFEFAYHGKVRDVYGDDQTIALISTDRTSAYDVVVGTVPGKGKVLNSLSAFLFAKTADIVPNHLIDVPHPNVTIAKRAEQALPVEVIVRGYMAESETDTSVFKHYQAGERTIYGIQFPDGLKPNQKFDEPKITPTTKAEQGEHDQMLTQEKAKQIVDTQFGWGYWDVTAQKAIALYLRGEEIYGGKGLILADTKFEFARIDNEITLIDEVLTPDSSRLWEADEYEERFAAIQKQVSLDKQIIRNALAELGFKGKGEVPVLPAEVIDQTASAYNRIYERITGEKLPEQSSNVWEIRAAVITGLRH